MDGSGEPALLPPEKRQKLQNGGNGTAAAHTADTPPLLAAEAAAAAASNGTGAAAPLAGLCILLHGSIPLLQRRLKTVQARLQQLGAGVCLELPGPASLAPAGPQHQAGSSNGGGKEASAQPRHSKQQPRHAKRASKAGTNSTTAAVPASSSCSRITHVVLQPPDPAAAVPWRQRDAARGGRLGAPATTSTSNTDRGGSGSDGGASGGGGSGSGGGAHGSSGAATSPRGGVQQLLKQLAAYKEQQQQPVQLVSAAWIEAVLSSGRHVPESRYALDHLLQQPGGGGSNAPAAGAPALALLGAANAAIAAAGSRGGGSLAATLRQMPLLLALPDAPLGRFAPWLGRWEPAFDDMTSQVELMLQASYCAVASAGRGPNEAVRAGLKQLEAIETAIGGGSVRRAVKGGEPPPLNHEALCYAHAAAAMRGCAFPLSPDMTPPLLQELLPFCGAFTARIIHQLLTTGSCEPLERYMANKPVFNSKGEVRQHTAGGAARELFARLPGVGTVTALHWFEAGCTTFEQVLARATAAGTGGGSGDAAAAAAGTNDGSSDGGSDQEQEGAAAAAAAGGGGGGGGAGSSGRAAAAPPPSSGTLLRMNKTALHSLQHHQELMAPVSTADREQMQQAVLDALVQVSGAGPDGWVMQTVGGGRRGRSVHDADFLVTHPTVSLEGLVGQLHSHLEAAGRVVPRSQGGFISLQSGCMGRYKQRARVDIIKKEWILKHQMDSYDHLWCIFITPDGRRRRLDVMLVPPAMWVHALMGWTGSKQYLRFLRQHAGNLGLSWNSHALFRLVSVRNKRPPLLHAPSSAAAAAATQAAAAARGGLDSLDEALHYVACSANAGAQHVVLSLPDEAPPVDRLGREVWPPGWSGADADAVPGSADGDRPPDGADAAAAAARLAKRRQLALLVESGLGSDRPLQTEVELTALLGVPFLQPSARCA